MNNVLKILTHCDAKENRNSHKRSVRRTERSCANGNRGNHQTNIVHQQRVHPRKIGDVATQDTAKRIRDADDRDQIRRRTLIDSLQQILYYLVKGLHIGCMFC